MYFSNIIKSQSMSDQCTCKYKCMAFGKTSVALIQMKMYCWSNHHRNQRWLSLGFEIASSPNQTVLTAKIGLGNGWRVETSSFWGYRIWNISINSCYRHILPLSWQSQCMHVSMTPLRMVTCTGLYCYRRRNQVKFTGWRERLNNCPDLLTLWWGSWRCPLFPALFDEGFNKKNVPEPLSIQPFWDQLGCFIGNLNHSISNGN